jgi:small-conductance mechanosensitive channel
LGVAGVIAGVALKDLVSSIFSGMLIGIDKAFKVGLYYDRNSFRNRTGNRIFNNQNPYR